MKVHVDGMTYIESDEHQYVLKTYTGKKVTMNKGKDNEYERDGFVIHGYYGTIKQALNAVLTMKIKESTASNIAELIDEIDSLHKYIADITKRESIK